MTPHARSTAAPLRAFVADLRDFDEKQLDVMAVADRRGVDRMRPRRRVEYLAGRALLRFAAAQATGRAVGAHTFTSRAGGKLDCLDGPAVSISHSHSLLACAVASAGDVGIDVQFPTRHHHTEEIARRWFTRSECAWLQRAPREAFYQLWVLKEAYLKCLGTGLAGGLASLDCRIDAATIDVRAADSIGLALYAVGDAFLGIAASAADVAAFCVEPWSPLPSPPSAPPVRLIATTASA